jgi:hypothetical protein
VQFKSLPWWLWLIPVVMLLIATARMPYGYYTLTRIVVCGFAVLLATLAWEGGSASRTWSVIFGAVALLFNPIVPIYLKRTTWFGFDIGAAVPFAIHLVFVRLRSARKTADSSPKSA